MTSPDIRNEVERGPREDLPSFLRESGRIDRILYTSLALIVAYGFAIIPFRAVLLLRYAFLYVWPTGSNPSALILASENEDRPLFLFAAVVIAALSIIRFMPFFHRTGKKRGPEFIIMSFSGHPPRWPKKMENSIYERIGLSVLASFVPFSPIPTMIMMAVGDTAKARDWVVGMYLFLCAATLKCFYLHLGLTFGPSIQDPLQMIDRYATYVTLVLIG